MIILNTEIYLYPSTLYAKGDGKKADSLGFAHFNSVDKAPGARCRSHPETTELLNRAAFHFYK